MIDLPWQVDVGMIAKTSSGFRISNKASFCGSDIGSMSAKRFRRTNGDVEHRQRNARRRRSQPKEDWIEVSFLVGKRKVKQCVVLRRRRLLVLRLVALAMAFKNVRNLLLINHNDGFIDDDEFVLLYDLFVSKNLDFP